MPIYEYHCEKCGTDFEYLIFGNDKPECISCSSRKVKKLMSACSFQTKGGGGETVASSASGSSCSGCASTNCSSCSH